MLFFKKGAGDFMFTAKLNCDICDKPLDFNEEYFFQSKLQDSLGITNMKKYYQGNGTIYCAACMKNRYKES